LGFVNIQVNSPLFYDIIESLFSVAYVKRITLTK